jgi:hypothetical protein
VSECLALVYIRDVNLDDGAFQTPDAVVQCDACMGIGACIEHNTIVTSCEACLLHFVDEFTLYIALIVVYLDVGVKVTQLLEIGVE